MGKLLDQAQLKLEEMENKAYESKGRLRQKIKDMADDHETTDTY